MALRTIEPDDDLPLVASCEEAEGRVMRICAGGHIVQIIIPGAPETELRLGPTTTRKLATALMIAADRAETS